jgi:AI-2 transport protein TqsA
VTTGDAQPPIHGTAARPDHGAELGDGNAPGRAPNLLLGVASLIVIVAGMRAAAPIVVPFLLAGFIAVVCAPPMFWLQRRGVPAVLAVIAVILAVMVAGLLIGALVGTALSDFPAAVPGYQARLHDQVGVLRGWLAAVGLALPDPVAAGYLDPGKAMELVAGLLAGFGGMLGNAFLILLTVVFMLLEAATLPDKLRRIVRDPDTTLPRFEAITAGIKRYLGIKTVVSLGTGIAVALWLAVLGVDYPLLWGLLAFLFNYVPNIGSFIAAVPAILLGLIQLGVSSALLVAAGYTVVNVIVGNVVEPRFMGRGVGLSTLVVFLSLVFWGWVLGPVGMLLSVPLTMVAKIALEGREATRPIAILLGSEVASAPAEVVGEGETP